MALPGAWADGLPDRVEPQGRVLGNGEVPRVEDQPRVPIREGLRQPNPDRFPVLAVDVTPLALGPVLPHPPTVLAPEEPPLTGTSPLPAHPFLPSVAVSKLSKRGSRWDRIAIMPLLSHRDLLAPDLPGERPRTPPEPPHGVGICASLAALTPPGLLNSIASTERHARPTRPVGGSPGSQKQEG